MELDGVTFLTRQDDVKTKSSTLRFSAPKELFKELINIENEYTVDDYDIFKITIVVKFPIGVFEQNVSLIDVVVLRNFGHMKTFRNVKLSPDDINKLILLAKDYIPEKNIKEDKGEKIMIKEILKKANRYYDVTGILSTLTTTTELEFGVNMYDDNGLIRSTVDGEDVRKEARILLELINEEKYGRDYFIFRYLDRYVENCSDILLHNYAVSISHNVQPVEDMDIIKTWEILDNLIMCWNKNLLDDWNIPLGWQKTDTEPETKPNDIPVTSKYSSNQEDRMFIKEDTYTCPYCGLIVEREKLPNPPEFKMAIISRNDIECPNCGNYGMNYMTSGLGSRMFGYTLADLCRK